MSQRQQRQQYDELLKLLKRQLLELDKVEQQLLELDKVEQRVLAEEKRQFSMLERVQRRTIECSRYASEAVWAEVFNNTISDSKWLYNKSFAAGRWAVGYPYLYVMYRVLNETQPKHILELGLGESTKMIAQYCAANHEAEHYVVESDPDWVAFFNQTFKLPANSEVICLGYEMTPYKETESVRVFKGFEKKFAGKKFDFISIDAPYGGDMKQYARIDILSILPDCIGENFVIMIDDCERSGETHTIDEIEGKLKDVGILYKVGRYCGKKDLILITAVHMGFLTSM